VPSCARADDAHHPTLVMVEEEAMDYPIARIVGDEGDIG
jgi:hypothetical protein